MAGSNRNLRRASIVILLVAIGVMVVMWLAWNSIGEGIRRDGMEARVEQESTPSSDPADALPANSNPAGLAGSTRRDTPSR